MPVGVELGKRADFVEACHFSRIETPGRRGEIVHKLRLVARPEDHGVHPRLVDHPVQRHLRGRDIALLADLRQHVNDPIQPLEIDRARGVQLIQPRLRRTRIAAEFSRQQTGMQRAPGHDANALIEPHRHELVLHFSRDERVVDLLAHVPNEVIPFRTGQRLHHVPRRMVRTADVADLALADEIVEGAQALFDGHELIGLVTPSRDRGSRSADAAGWPRTRR